MAFFARFSPLRAYRDLRVFLSDRQPYELWFLVAAMVITAGLILAFAHDSYAEPEYRRQITYVEQWPADRSDAQIRAQQAIDAPIKAARVAAEKAADERRRESFRKVDNAMSAWGL